MSMISPCTIRALLDDIEVEDPIDFGDLPVDEERARSLVVTQLAEMRERLVRHDLSGEAREAVLLATASRVILENLLLHVRVCLDHPDSGEDEFAALIARLGGGPGAA